ncbi:MAG TPA: response regulator [Bryobacteraceae bacterium]|nr:response regulator [Bryobacteraceae bacterium]
MRLETILVVDDNLAARRLMRIVLAQEGYRVLMAKDLDKALTLCRGRIHFDLLIVEAILRTMRGKLVAECFNELRPGVPILYTSGRPLAELIEEGLVDPRSLQHGKAHFIQKPFTVKGLLQTVSQILEPREPIRQTARGQ